MEICIIEKSRKIDSIKTVSQFTIEPQENIFLVHDTNQ